MVIDSSAVAAILFDEPDFRRYSDAIEAAPIRFMSVVTRVELSFVIESRKGLAGRQRLDRFFQMSGTEIVSATPQQAAIAIEAFRRFGKGHHKAALNIGDCFSYALASTTGHHAGAIGSPAIGHANDAAVSPAPLPVARFAHPAAWPASPKTPGWQPPPWDRACPARWPWRWHRHPLRPANWSRPRSRRPPPPHRPATPRAPPRPSTAPPTRPCPYRKRPRRFKHARACHCGVGSPHEAPIPHFRLLR